MTATITFELDANGPAIAHCTLRAGSLQFTAGDSYASLTDDARFATIPLTDTIPVPAGTHTIQVQCDADGPNTPTVRALGGSARTLTVLTVG